MGGNVITSLGLEEGMIVKVLSGRKEEDIELPIGASGFDLLAALGLLPDAHILMRGASPFPIDETLVEGERVRIVKVASGG
jgi:sulfur carrier protein ThiS